MLRAVCAAALAATVAVLSGAATAADSPATLQPLRDRVFLFSGIDVTRDSASSWAGFVAAPAGLLASDGIRFRLSGSYGRYRYQSDTLGGENRGQASSGEVMLGWRQALGAAIVTTFLGGQIVDHRLDIADPSNPVAGTAAGVKAAIEFFARMRPDLYVTSSASASTVHGLYDARAALAHEIGDSLVVGVEGALLGDARHVVQRAGLFSTVKFGRATATLAGGIVMDSEGKDGPYGTLSLYSPY